MHRGGWLSHGDHTLLLLLLLFLFPSVLRRLMMTNHAAGAKDTMMARKVTGNPPDRRTLQAARRLSRHSGPTDGYS
jgi:hypothetical protein